MNDELFAELVESVREGAAILRGEAAPCRSFAVERTIIDTKGLREKYHLSQTEFASMLGISVKTLRNWEQGRRAP